MGSHFSLKDVPLPKSWASGVKAGVLHAISLAHLVIIYARGWATNSRNARIRLAAELKEVEDEISRLREEIRRGRYQVRARDIARKMLTESFLNASQLDP